MNAVTEKRILQALDEPAPAGYSRWNVRLLAEHLGNVSKDQVWRLMRKHDLHLERRQSWCVSTDPVHSGHYRRRRRREFLDFMNELVGQYPGKELHVVLDNLNTHKPKDDRWLKAHPQVHFHFIPTHSSWLNRVECWFSILSRSTLQGSSFTSVRMLIEAIEAFIGRWNQNAAPFEWTKHEAHQQELKRSYADLCN